MLPNSRYGRGMGKDLARRGSGHLIVLKPEAFVRTYEETSVAKENGDKLATLRAAITSLAPERYRGMGRYRLVPFPSLDPGVIRAFADTGIDMETDRQARRRYRELIGDDPPVTTTWMRNNCLRPKPWRMRYSRLQRNWPSGK